MLWNHSGLILTDKAIVTLTMKFLLFLCFIVLSFYGACLFVNNFDFHFRFGRDLQRLQINGVHVKWLCSVFYLRFRINTLFYLCNNRLCPYDFYFGSSLL